MFETIKVKGEYRILIKRAGETEWKLHAEGHNVITNAGKDFICAQVGSTSPGANGANYVALSNEGTEVQATDTTLASEIAANGLTRAIGAYAHSAGTTSFTITKTFTCITLAQACQKYGLFTAASSGTMLSGKLFTAASLQVGDSLQFTATITFA